MVITTKEPKALFELLRPPLQFWVDEASTTDASSRPSRFRVWGFGFAVGHGLWGFGSRVRGSGFRSWGLRLNSGSLNPKP